MFGGQPEHPLTLSAPVSTTTTTSTRHRCRPSAPVPVRPSDRTTPLRQALLPLPTTALSRLHHKPSAPVPARPGDRTTLAPAVARRRPRCRPTFPVSRLVRRADAAPCVLRNSSLGPQFPATSGGSSHRTKLSFALHGLSDLVLYHSAPTVEPILSSNCTSAPRLFTTLPLTAKHTCIHEHGL